MNKQPFYHRAVVLFTVAGVTLDYEELADLLRRALKSLPENDRMDVIIDSVDCEEVDAEPGDPADLC